MRVVGHGTYEGARVLHVYARTWGPAMPLLFCCKNHDPAFCYGMAADFWLVSRWRLLLSDTVVVTPVLLVFVSGRATAQLR